ncbi:hypothetical protein [Streptomyces sp. NPDC012508]|uniref:hypothetical protein n=1 Tax=Streptomyces sp. NPDC012508 TaxID=3364837 RepID=UPI0036C3DF2D
MRDEMEAAARRLADGTPLAEALDVSSATAWIALDEHVRTELQWRRAAAGHTWRAPTFSGVAEPDPSAVALALCDPDGRVREAALAPAGAEPSLLPLIAIRCADWVAPVRDGARDLLRAALPGAGAAAMPALAAVILRAGVRLRGGVARELLEAALGRCDAVTLDAVLASGDRAGRRLAHRVAVERGHFSPARLAEIAAREGDVVIQDVCSGAALAGSGTGTGDEVLLPLLRSRQSRVRSAGVTALHRTGLHARAEPFLYDRSSMVRACARWVMRQDGRDPLELYRARCGDGDVPAGAPIGLAESGSRADAALLWPLTGHPLAVVRAQAVAGLRVLGAQGLQRLAPLLDDPAPGVVREAVAALVPWAHLLRDEELTLRLAPDLPRHIRVGAFRLLAARGGPAYGEGVRMLVDDAEPKLRARARAVAGRATPAGRRRAE